MNYRTQFCSHCLTDRRIYTDRTLAYCGVCGRSAKVGPADVQATRESLHRRFGRILGERSTP